MFRARFIDYTRTPPMQGASRNELNQGYVSLKKVEYRVVVEMVGRQFFKKFKGDIVFTISK